MEVAMNSVSAADIVKRRLALGARRLGTVDPLQTVGPLIDRSFELPFGDPRYGHNALLPGSLPLEPSFSEASSNALRFSFEPMPPGTAPLGRRQEVSREMRRLTQQHFGRPALQWYDQASEPWRGSNIHGGARFGAWFGAAFDDSGVQTLKSYYELAPGQLEELPANLKHAAHIALETLPGLQPLFTSIACGRRRGAQRLYLVHRGELRLLDLEPLMRKLGIGKQVPSLLQAVGLILGGRFTLPDNSVMLGLRDTPKGIEMKLDILLPAVPDPPREMHGLIQMFLEQRPEAQQALGRWLRAMSLDGEQSPGAMSVFGVRVTPDVGARLSIYFRPVGYEVQSARPEVLGRPRRASAAARAGGRR
jgi:hypothetical protein